MVYNLRSRGAVASRKRARSPSPGLTIQPPTSRRRWDTAPPKSQLAPNGDVLLLFENVISGDEAAGKQALTTAKCLRVSSAHLTLKSRVFRAMFADDKYGEAVCLRDQGWIELPLPEDDYDAFTVIVNIVHGHLWQVPKSIDLSLLAKIATLVDKYEWHEIMIIWAETWFISLGGPYETSMGEDFMPWLWVCWVFGREDEFEFLTRFAMKQATHDEQFQGSLAFPVPCSVTCGCSLRIVLIYGDISQRQSVPCDTKPSCP